MILSNISLWERWMFDAVEINKPLVHKINYPGDLSEAVSKIRKQLITTKPNVGVMSGGGKTTVGDGLPHTWPEFEEFMLWLKPKVEQLWKDLDLTDCDLQVMKSWCNATKNNAYVTEHDHGGCHFAVSFYVRKPKDSGNIEFRNIQKELYANYPMHRQGWIEVEAEEQDLLIFPGFLSHRVQPNTTDQERIVLSFNIHGVNNHSPVLLGNEGQ